MRTTLRFVGGPVDGRSCEIADTIKTVNVPVFPSRADPGIGQFVYRRCRLGSGEEVLVPLRIEDTAGRA